MERQHGLLHQIFCFFAVGNQMVHGAVDRGIVAGKQGFECLLVALLHLAQKVAVW
jgi:hypothetical protein